MKNIIGILLAIFTGITLGFFGVFASVFADGGISERLIVIGIVLLIYAVLGALWGAALPIYSWQWGLFLGLPGVFLLAIFMLREFNPYYFIYIILIITVSCLSAYGGNVIKSRKKS